MGLLILVSPKIALFLLIFLLHNGVFAQRAKSAEQLILERIFADRTYDQRVRPVYSDNSTAPVVVTVNFYLRSIDSLDDKTQEFRVQLTYRQNWRDERLSFSSNGMQQVSLINPHNQIWRPDTFFANEREGKYHELMSRNEFVRISSKGDVLQSSRISLRLSCPMSLRKFPLDFQTCGIRLASYGYTTNEVKYEWKKEDPVQVPSNLIVQNFFLEGLVTSHCDSVTTTGSYSCLRVDFKFKRLFTPYLIHVYIPTTMMVIVAWLSFWVSAQFMTGRIIMTVLTLFVLAIQTADVNKLFPYTSYTKAVDHWTGTCLTFVMASLVEFIVVQYILRRCNQSEKNNSSNYHQQQLDSETDAAEPDINRDEEQEIPLKDLSLNDGNGKDGQDGGKPAKITERVRDFSKRYLANFETLPAKIDGASRVIYPVAFLIYNVLYWLAVLLF